MTTTTPVESTPSSSSTNSPSRVLRCPMSMILRASVYSL